MSKKLRDFLFIAFILLFIIITFFVGIYAAGYSLNKQWPPRFNSLFEKTGMLIVDSKPNGANIFLNEQKQNKSFLINWGKNEIKTPAKIKNLAPGKYTLRLEKEGYWPLEKEVEIRSGQTSFAEDFIIFKKSLPLNLAICEPQKFIFSDNQKNLLLEMDSLIINLKTGDINNLDLNNTKNITWLDSKNQLSVNNILIGLNNTSSPLSTLITPDAYNLRWNEDGKKLYYQLKNTLNCLTIETSATTKVLTPGNYKDYTVYQNKIYTIEKIQDKSYLNIYDVNNSLLQSNTELPSGEYNFYEDNYHLNIYDKQHQELYILNQSNIRPIIRKISNIIDWQWLNNNFILWRNESEIYSMDINNNRQNLIIRISEKLTGLALNKSKSYLIYSSAQNIWIVNLNLEKIVPIQLLQAEQISNLSLDEKNQIIYFYAKIDDKAGIYKLQLQ